MKKDSKKIHFVEYEKIIGEVLKKITVACPELNKKFYLGGSLPVSLKEGDRGQLKHTISLDLDLHTLNANDSTSKEAEVLTKAFKENLTWHEVDYDFGMYRGTIKFKGVNIDLDLFSNFESIEKKDLESFTINGAKLFTPSLSHHIKTKLGCLEDREDPKDIYHLFCIKEKFPNKSKEIERGISKLSAGHKEKIKTILKREWVDFEKVVKENNERGTHLFNTRKCLIWALSLLNKEKAIKENHEPHVT
jgi:hypothetical protein